MTPQLYFVRHAFYAPAILAAVAIGLAIGFTWWWLAALPCILLGSLCASPNLNFADGFLGHLVLLVGLIMLAFYQPLGLAISTGTFCSYIASVVEKTMHMRPATESELRQLLPQRIGEPSAKI